MDAFDLVSPPLWRALAFGAVEVFGLLLVHLLVAGDAEHPRRMR